MRNFYRFIALSLVGGVAVASPAAFAQTSPSGDMQAPRLQPKDDVGAPLPPAVPGAGDQGLQTSQSVAKQQSGDPTAELFTAINGNDYNSAQDAISRGADLNAQNALGETPIDLSVALNRNSITFMLLSARNEDGDDSGATSPAPATVAQTPLTAPAPKYYSTHTTATQSYRPSSAIPVNDPGTPNPSAGFLGFGPKN